MELNPKPPVRYRMKINTSSVPEERGSRSCRSVSVEDIVPLAVLMKESYAGTIDYNGETLEQCREEIESTLKGKYGAFLGVVSFLVEDGKGAQSASLVTLYDNKPLLAFSMTRPDAQGRGLARMLITESIKALAREGYPELFLTVTEGNSVAERLYESLGFTRVVAETNNQLSCKPR